MAGRIEAHIAKLNIELPRAPAPGANYVPYVVSGSLAFIAGQVTVWNGDIKFHNGTCLKCNTCGATSGCS